MICPHCQRELATAVSFCPCCGKEILFPCPHCKAYIAPQDVICPNCGRGRTELPASQMAQAERYVPRLASEVRPRILASKLMQENYPPFFQMLLKFYQYDTRGSLWLAKAIAGMVMQPTDCSTDKRKQRK